MDNNWLLQYKKDITSQEGEDGILEKILEILKIDKGWCVDVGAYGLQYSNVYSLMQKDWNGVFIEKRPLGIKRLRRMYVNNHAYFFCDSICPDGEKTLDNFLKQTDISNDFELLNIDIDGNDFYIWESLKNYSPKLVIIEFNPTKGFDDFLQSVDGKDGASLSITVDLGKKLGYELIATTAFNAFFVRKDLFDKFNINDNSIHNMWVENKSTYGKSRRRHR